MTKRNAFYAVLLLTFFACFPSASAAAGDSSAAVWDTVLAEIQIIESSDGADSLKSQLMADLFARYNLTAQDYRSYYETFRSLPIEEQRRIMERVKEVMPRLLKLKGVEYPASNARFPASRQKKE